jgi:hypothetical protein
MSFRGAYYGACYDKTYSTLPEMAVGSLQLVRANVRLRDLHDYTGLTGRLRFIGLKISDLYWSNSHDIRVCRVQGAADPAVNGYYIGWGQNWKAGGFKAEWFGPTPPTRSPPERPPSLDASRPTPRTAFPRTFTPRSVDHVP